MPKEQKNGSGRLMHSGRVQVKAVGLKGAPLSDLYYFLMTSRWSVFLTIVVVAYACA
jgi:hypothetical protein